MLLALFVFNCKINEPSFVETSVPKGPMDYQLGWYDGCRSGFATHQDSSTSIYNASFGSGCTS